MGPWMPVASLALAQDATVTSWAGQQMPSATEVWRQVETGYNEFYTNCHWLGMLNARKYYVHSFGYHFFAFRKFLTIYGTWPWYSTEEKAVFFSSLLIGWEEGKNQLISEIEVTLISLTFSWKWFAMQSKILTGSVQWIPDNSHKRRDFFFLRIKQNVWIIHTSKSMVNHTIVRITIVWIIRGVRTSEGQIIRAILYQRNRFNS